MKNPLCFALMLATSLTGCSMTLPTIPQSTSYHVPAGQHLDFEQDLAECRSRAEAAIAAVPSSARDPSVYESYNTIVKECLKGKGYRQVDGS